MKYEVEASFAYGITKPGDVPYSSENFRGALTLTEEIEASDEAEARDLGLQRLATIAQDAKLQVINEAGLSSATDENGVIHPVFGQAVEKTATNVTPITSSPSYTGDDGADSDNFLLHNQEPTAGEYVGGQAPPPLWDGRPIKIFDNRDNKRSDKSPDFRILFLDAPEGASDDDKFKPFWLKNKDGTMNPAALKVQSMV
jgi:hypothetical protein